MKQSEEHPFRPMIPTPDRSHDQGRDNIGYHIKPIEKGVFGEPEKIFEEVDEFRDALSQKSMVMALVELSDLYGAISGYLEKYHPSIGMADLAIMSDITQRAFRNGRRD